MVEKKSLLSNLSGSAVDKVVMDSVTLWQP